MRLLLVVHGLLLVAGSAAAAVEMNGGEHAHTTKSKNSVMSRVLLNDEFSTSLRAACLDGSPPAYYVREASSPEDRKKFVIYFQGGGWCYTLEECMERSKTPIGSSKT